MSADLVALTLDRLGGNVPGILSNLLGEPFDKTQAAIAGGVLALLGGLADAVAEGGPSIDKIAAAINDQDPALLDQLDGQLSSGSDRALIVQSLRLLNSLLGAAAVDAMTPVLGRFAGIGGGSAKSLLGLLGPIVIAVLGRQQRDQGLDRRGLAKLLLAQKDPIAAALPPGLPPARGPMDQPDRPTVQAPAPASKVEVSLEATGSGPIGTARRGSPWLRWGVTLVIVLALIWLALGLLRDDSTGPSDRAPTAPGGVPPTSESAP